MSIRCTLFRYLLNISSRCRILFVQRTFMDILRFEQFYIYYKLKKSVKSHEMVGIRNILQPESNIKYSVKQYSKYVRLFERTNIRSFLTNRELSNDTSRFGLTEKKQKSKRKKFDTTASLSKLLINYRIPKRAIMRGKLIIIVNVFAQVLIYSLP